MDKGPRVIRTNMGNGLETLVPYGISVDVTNEMRGLRAYFSELGRSLKSQRARR